MALMGSVTQALSDVVNTHVAWRSSALRLLLAQ
jgi:hypothetical protein